MIDSDEYQLTILFRAVRYNAHTNIQTKYGHNSKKMYKLKIKINNTPKVP